MIVIIGLTPIELGSRLPSATYRASGAVDRAVGANDASSGIGVHSRRPHRMERLEAQGAGRRRRGLQVGDPVLRDRWNAGDLRIDLAGAGGVEELRGAGDPEHQPSGVVVREAIGDPQRAVARQPHPPGRPVRQMHAGGGDPVVGEDSLSVLDPRARKPLGAECKRREGGFEQDSAVLPLVHRIALHHPVPARAPPRRNGRPPSRRGGCAGCGPAGRSQSGIPIAAGAPACRRRPPPAPPPAAPEA